MQDFSPVINAQGTTVDGTMTNNGNNILNNFSTLTISNLSKMVSELGTFNTAVQALAQTENNGDVTINGNNVTCGRQHISFKS
ncbi:hypothetical protein [Helicobacter heilmannii]|uniref:hypothetical protein n=1 Tax=Helicobacter heilmannii TaxID=35817 RepID=UPI0006A00852|nr:hypothetical protein [Helicobacter heilmannii]GMB94986.1 hypothetical protein NHP21011_10810 [Helicobacter heilmannii]CRF51510.1 hypothetical protein HHE06_13940 [Helicobacter heilmannii]